MRPLNAHDPSTRRDPAPSRIEYRLQRLWLTPAVRLGVRLGLPVLLVAAGLAIWLGDADRRKDLYDRYVDLRREIEERPEFMVTALSVDGASPEVAQEIRRIMPVNLPISSFHLDLDALRAVVTELDAVAAADLRIKPGGILHVGVTERVPVVIVQRGERFDLTDAKGHRVATLTDRAARPDLPLIAGQGAARQVAEARALFAAAGPLKDRLRGFVRVGERRWDVVLDRDQRILLPEEGAVSAFERAVALDEAADLLARDVAVVDLRNAARPTLRLSDSALADYRQNKGMNTEVSGQ